jgi:hypothetical protein
MASKSQFLGYGANPQFLGYGSYRPRCILSTIRAQCVPLTGSGNLQNVVDARRWFVLGSLVPKRLIHRLRTNPAIAMVTPCSLRPVSRRTRLNPAHVLRLCTFAKVDFQLGSSEFSESTTDCERKRIQGDAVPHLRFVYFLG